MKKKLPKERKNSNINSVKKNAVMLEIQYETSGDSQDVVTTDPPSDRRQVGRLPSPRGPATAAASIIYCFIA